MRLLDKIREVAYTNMVAAPLFVYATIMVVILYLLFTR